MSPQNFSSLAPQRKGLEVLLSFVASSSSGMCLSPNPAWGCHEFIVLPLSDSSDSCGSANTPKSTWCWSSCLSQSASQRRRPILYSPPSHRGKNIAIQTSAWKKKMDNSGVAAFCNCRYCPAHDSRAGTKRSWRSLPTQAIP